MKLEEGKYYRSRDGNVTGPLRCHWHLLRLLFTDAKRGLWHEDGRACGWHSESSKTLIEEVPKERGVK